MAVKTSKNLYYYAGGKRIALESAGDLVAVDDTRLAEKLPTLLASDTALRGGTPLRGGIRLVRIDALDSATLEQMQSAGVTQPVFRHDGAILIALPEIRIEDENAAKLAKVRKFAVGKVQAVADDVVGRLTLHPLSNNGRDALALANEVFERYKPASVSPRFLRVVPGPVVPT